MPTSTTRTRSDATSAPIQPSTYLYDASESYEAFKTRQRRAYEAGRLALQERRIKAATLVLYELLVRYTGGNTHTWVSEATLADECAVDVATIKRWIARLLAAGLIRRERRFATSSRTYIVAYDISSTDNLSSQHDDYRQSNTTDVRRNSATTHSAESHPESPTEILSGGGGDEVNSEISEILEREQVSNYAIAPQLSDKPLHELQAIRNYLDKQHNIKDRARLFAWLASRNFGAELLKRQAADESSCNTSTDDSSAATTLNPIWQQVLAVLQQQVPAVEFVTWLEPTRLLSIDESSAIAIVGSDNIFQRDTLRLKYSSSLTSALRMVADRELHVQIEIG